MFGNSNLTLGFYFKTLRRIFEKPNSFFTELPEYISLKQPLFFLGISGLLFSIFSVISRMPIKQPIVWGGIFFLNAVGMTFIASGTGYMIMIMIMGRQNSVGFNKFFSIYAFATGLTLLASWAPFFIYLTEPWKWWLIGSGMIKNFGFQLKQVIIIIGISILVITLFFLSLSFAVYK